MLNWDHARDLTCDVVDENIYPDVFDVNIQEKIARMLEFTSLDGPLSLFSYQEFVRRYMSPYTPYKFLILFHSLGSGKSVASISAAVDNYLVLGRKCYIITRGESSENNFREQIKKYAKLSSKKIPGKMFEYYHYIQLANLIGKMDVRELEEFFRDKVFIMDEIHNLKDIKIDGTLEKICRGVKVSRNCKFIYSTATPMIDSWTEIESLMMLVDRQLPQNPTYEDLSESLRGIVSYSTKSLNKAKEKYMGKYEIGGIKFYASYMTGSQEKYYRIEKLKSTKNVYQTLVHMSLFCLPDGKYGTDVINEHMTENIIEVKDENCRFKSIKFKDDFVIGLTPENLEEISAIYKSLLEIILATFNEKIFIFLEHITGSGIIILAGILQSNGYDLYGGGSCKTIKKRFTICVGDDSICPNINTRLEFYNSDDNVDGEYVQILIGSKVIGESVNLMNVKQFHFVSQHWNYSYLNQSKGRVIREGSHPPNSEVKIYNHICLLPDTESIDLYKVKMCKKKISSIMDVEKIMIDNAVDKYVYDSPFETTNELSFSLLYSDDYISQYVEIIFDVMENDAIVTAKFLLDYFRENYSVPLEMIADITRKIIIRNISHDEKYLRCCYRGLYTTTDVHWPFWDFPPTTHETAIDISDVKFEDLKNVHERIAYLENLAIRKSISKKFKNLFFESDGSLYHCMDYRKNNKAYSASVMIPTKLSQKTKVLNQGVWKVISSIEEEKTVLQKYRVEWESFVASSFFLPFFGYISIIDNAIRYKEGGNSTNNDKRKISRGISLSSMKLSDVRRIASEIGIDINSLKKYELIKSIEKYAKDNKLYCYF